MRSDAEIPFFFGPGGDLFGMFHATAQPARQAVLMCPPLGQDLIRCHRVYRQLAQSLAASGVAVLRFDYHGTGDSAGDSAEVDWDRCVADTLVAAAELRSRAGVERPVAFGARLGGSIALSASAKTRFAEVIAWDPVTDGAAYVAVLDTMQASLREDANRFIRPRTHADVAAQWLGFDVGDRLREQLARLRIGIVQVPTLWIDSQQALQDRQRVAAISPPVPWNDMRKVETAILSPALIHAVSGRLKETAYA